MSDALVPPITYIDWDYDTGIAVEYERSGACNGCGACCYARIAFAVVKETDPQQGGRGVDGSGVWSEIARGNVRRYFRFHPVDPSIYEKCSMLNYDNRCRLHEFGAKKLIQSGYPFTPLNITPFPTCSYSFREVRRWAFDVPAKETQNEA